MNPLFIYSLEKVFTDKVKKTLNYTFNNFDYDVVYLCGLSPISIIASRVCREKDIKYFVFLPRQYHEELELTKELEEIIKNAHSVIFLPCKKTKPELYTKELQKYIVSISAMNALISKSSQDIKDSLTLIMENCGNYSILPAC